MLRIIIWSNTTCSNLFWWPNFNNSGMEQYNNSTRSHNTACIPHLIFSTEHNNNKLDVIFMVQWIFNCDGWHLDRVIVSEKSINHNKLSLKSLLLYYAGNLTWLFFILLITNEAVAIKSTINTCLYQHINSFTVFFK